MTLKLRRHPAQIHCNARPFSPLRLPLSILLAACTLVVGAASVKPQMAAAQECRSGSTGPIPGDPNSTMGMMCDLGTIRTTPPFGSYPVAVSSDGRFVAGNVYSDTGFFHAYRWGSYGSVMEDLGAIGTEYNASLANAISADGSVIVGETGVDHSGPQGANSTQYITHAFVWTKEGGMQQLGTLRNGNSGNSSATDVSADGTIVVGRTSADSIHPSPLGDGSFTIAGSITTAFLWTDGQMRRLGNLNGDNHTFSDAVAISDDGTTIVGRSQATNDGVLAVRWVDDGNRIESLGRLRTDNVNSSAATAVSADGSVIVGGSTNNAGNFRAFRWTDDGKGMQDLGALQSENHDSSIATAVSADGTTVIGKSWINQNSTRAFRWLDDGAGMQDLGTLRSDNSGRSNALAVSADGRIVVGGSESDTEIQRAFRWSDDGSGMQDLGTFRADNTGQSEAVSVSADGKVIVGWADYDAENLFPGHGYKDTVFRRSFIWLSQMQDYENLSRSYALLANDTEIAVEHQIQSLRHIADQACQSAGGGGCLRSTLTAQRTGGATDTGTGSQAKPSAILSYGYGVSDRLTAGLTVSFGRSHVSPSHQMESSYAGAIWTRFSENGAAQTGWQAGLALGFGKAAGTITRGRSLDNVMPTAGDATLTSRVLRTSAGYGFKPFETWLITPSFSVTHSRARRPSYAETGNDFNATYDATEWETTTVELGVSAKADLSDVSRLTLAGGVEHDLATDGVVLKGVSELPGMAEFELNSGLKRRASRGFVSASYSHDIGGATVSGSVQLAQPAYGQRPNARVGVSYGIRF